MTPTKKDEGTLEQGQEIEETCTQCGGLGYTPNLPHVIAKKCPRCKGVGKLNRELLLKAHYRTEAIDEFLAEIEGILAAKIHTVSGNGATFDLISNVLHIKDVRAAAERLKRTGEN